MASNIEYRSGMQWASACLAALLILASPFHAQARADEDLTEFSLEELMNVDVTSVSKKSQSKMGAAAAVTVITAEDIRRSGFTSVPEALRMVPGVQVARIDASRWAISIRGFLQEFTNKLLVMVDGRSVYTPLFGGTVWNEQNMAIEDIARIEVVRGPGGTLWGANAVNGIINIISKKASATQGTRLHLFGGSHESGIAGRYGGTIGETTQYRVSIKGEKIQDYDLDQSYSASDSMNQLRTSVRVDSQPTPRDEISFHLDYFDVDREVSEGIANPAPPFQTLGFNDQRFYQRGGNALLKYTHAFDSGSNFELKTYYDRLTRRSTVDEDTHTFDIESQHDFSPTEWMNVIWGLNYRYWTTHTQQGAGSLSLDPNDETFHLGSGFGQFQFDLFDDRLALIAGVKLSTGTVAGFEYQPSGRIVAKPVEGHTAWFAVSRAVRTPTYIDRDLAGALGPITLNGDRNVRSENLLSFEVGYRYHSLDWLSFELSAYHSRYDDFSTLVPVGPGQFGFSNTGDIEVRGLEIEITLIPTDWIRVVTGYSVLDYGDNDLPPSLVAGNRREPDLNPRHQFMIRSLFDLPYDLELDAAIFYVDGLPGVTPALASRNVEQYVRLDLRIGWRPLEWLEVSLVGQNLADNRHAEFEDIQGNQSSQVPRSGYAKFTFDF